MSVQHELPITRTRSARFVIEEIPLHDAISKGCATQVCQPADDTAELHHEMSDLPLHVAAMHTSKPELRDYRAHVGTGVSVKYGFDMNSLAVPRKAKEAIGGIAALKRPDGSTLTINVEYNLLDPLLRANGYENGDVNDDTGFSPFPGMFLHPPHYPRITFSSFPRKRHLRILMRRCAGR